MTPVIVRYPAYRCFSTVFFNIDAPKYASCFQIDVSLCMDSEISTQSIRGTLSGRLKLIIGKVAYDYDIELVELEVPEGHIHMVVNRTVTGNVKVAPF